MTAEEAMEEAAALATTRADAPSTATASGAAASLPCGLSGREAEVLRLVATGLTNGQIAERLFLSPRTVEAHLRRVYDKIGVASRGAATRFAVEQGLAG